MPSSPPPPPLPPSFSSADAPPPPSHPPFLLPTILRHGALQVLRPHLLIRTHVLLLLHQLNPLYLLSLPSHLRLSLRLPQLNNVPVQTQMLLYDLLPALLLKVLHLPVLLLHVLHLQLQQLAFPDLRDLVLQLRLVHILLLKPLVVQDALVLVPHLPLELFLGKGQLLLPLPLFLLECLQLVVMVLLLVGKHLLVLLLLLQVLGQFLQLHMLLHLGD